MSNTVSSTNAYSAYGSTPAGTLFDTLERRIPEVINNVLTNMLPGIDPAFNVIATSEGVESSLIGRDLIVRKLFQGALTGVVEMDTPTSYPGLFGGTTGTLPSQLAAGSGGSDVLFSTTATSYFPDVNKQVEPKPVEMAVALQCLKGNLKMTLGEIKLDALTNVIGDVVAPKLVGFAMQLARYRALMFYTNDNTDYSLCNMTNIEVGVGADAGRVVFTPSNDATARFARGMQVDLFFRTSDSGNYAQKLNVSASADCTTVATWQTYTAAPTVGTTNTSIACYVEAVDTMADRVTLVLKHGTWTDGNVTNATARQLPSGATPNYTIKVCAAGTKYLAANGEAISGLNTWIKSQGSIYNVALASFPEFKSLLYTDSGPLTEQKLRRIASRYNIAATQVHGFTIDSFITTQGVLDAYAATKIGEQRIDRTGSALSLDSEGGVTSATFMHDGRRYKLEPSSWCDYGVLYGLNKGGMRRYVPTRPAGMGTLPNAPAFLEFNFVAPLLTGNGSIRLPTTNSSNSAQWSDTIQMPGESRMEVIPGQFPMIKVSGLSEDKLVGDYNSDLLANS